MQDGGGRSRARSRAKRRLDLGADDVAAAGWTADSTAGANNNFGAMENNSHDGHGLPGRPAARGRGGEDDGRGCDDGNEEGEDDEEDDDELEDGDGEDDYEEDDEDDEDDGHENDGEVDDGECHAQRCNGTTAYVKREAGHEVLQMRATKQPRVADPVAGACCRRICTGRACRPAVHLTAVAARPGATTVAQSTGSALARAPAGRRVARRPPLADTTRRWGCWRANSSACSGAHQMELSI